MASGMAAKINVKNMDYFKFKKIVVDGNRDDYASCSREIRLLCDAVQTLAFRDELFADDQFSESNQLTQSSDRQHFDEILTGYRQILDGKRIDPVDIRIKTGWWADTASSTGSCGTAGKFKAAALRDTLLFKSNDWRSRQNRSPPTSSSAAPQLAEDLDRPGVFVFRHRERQCFQFVGRTTVGDKSVFATCNDLLKASFEGVRQVEPLDELASLLVVSMAADWDFYFVSVAMNESDAVLRIVENDVILKHDSIWPRGLNRMLHVTSPLEVSELRNSCLRHRWPPVETIELSANRAVNDIELDRLRKHVKNAPTQHVMTSSKEASVAANKLTPTTKSNHSSARTHQVATNGVDRPVDQQTTTAGGQKSPPGGKQRPNVHSTTATTTTATTSTPRARPVSAPRSNASTPRLSTGGPTVSSSRPQSASSTSRKDTVSASTAASGSGSKQTKISRLSESSADGGAQSRRHVAAPTTAAHGGPSKKATKIGVPTSKLLPPSRGVVRSPSAVVDHGTRESASATLSETEEQARLATSSVMMLESDQLAEDCRESVQSGTTIE